MLAYENKNSNLKEEYIHISFILRYIAQEIMRIGIVITHFKFKEAAIAWRIATKMINDEG